MTFSHDTISITMAFLAVFMTICAMVYAGDRSPVRSAPMWTFCVFACLACLASDWLVFTVFLELSSLALAFSVGEKDRAIARFYLYTQLAGGSLLLMATAMASNIGPASLGPVSERALPFFLLGLGIKVAFPGLHFWLPRTHSQAPTEASVLLSGYSVKIGIYGLIRLADGPSPGLVLLGAVMALYGVFQALMQHDGKRLLAYHTLSQLGFMITAIGTGTDLGISAALLHLVAHGLFKGLLFMSAGSLEKVYGTRDLGLLGSAAKDLPALFVLFLVGATAISGFPGTSGYASKALMKASLYAYPWAIWALQLAGIGTTLSFCKFCYYGFLHPASIGKRKLPVGSLSPYNMAAMVAMAFATLSLGLFPHMMPFFPEGFGSLWTEKGLLGGFVPIVAGVAIFSLFHGLFCPREGHVPDVEDLIPALSRFLSWPLGFLRQLHTGKLRFYIALLTGCLLVAFVALLYHIGDM